jgi:hypothetical protein
MLARVMAALVSSSFAGMEDATMAWLNGEEKKQESALISGKDTRLNGGILAIRIKGAWNRRNTPSVDDSKVALACRAGKGKYQG